MLVTEYSSNNFLEFNNFILFVHLAYHVIRKFVIADTLVHRRMFVALPEVAN